VTAPLTAVITMAGLGSRFRQAGYTCPKYKIEVRGRTLFAWSLESLRDFIDRGASFVFVTRRQDAASRFVRAECAALGVRSVEIVEIDALTDGQATTALLAARAIADPDAPIAIYNIDTHVDPKHLPVNATRGDGWIPVFPGAGSAWSFVRADDTGRALETREKVRISDHATVGLYYFSSFRLYEAMYREQYRTGQTLDAGERYIAPMYNRLIGSGHPVYIHELPAAAVVPLGTPGEVDRFAKQEYVDG
jgi:dTDP-glucose pyrophosphorylase